MRGFGGTTGAVEVSLSSGVSHAWPLVHQATSFLHFFCLPLDSPDKACYHSAHGDDGKSSLPARPSQRAAGAGKAAGPGK